MTRQMGFVHSALASTTTATTTPWPLPALYSALRLHALPKFGLGAPNSNQRRSTVNYRTCLKIMVSPVRARVPPLKLSSHLQENVVLSYAARSPEPLRRTMCLESSLMRL